MLQCQQRILQPFPPDGAQESVDRCKWDEVATILRRGDLDENCGIFAFNISRATTLISISQTGQSRTLIGWCVQHQQ